MIGISGIGEDEPDEPNSNPRAEEDTKQNPLQQNEPNEMIERAKGAEKEREEREEPNRNSLQQNEPTEALELAEKEPNRDSLQENGPLERTDEHPAMAAMPSNPSNAPQTIGKRRFSMAGGQFFSVNENVRELGTDFLTKVAKESNSFLNRPNPKF